MAPRRMQTALWLLLLCTSVLAQVGSSYGGFNLNSLFNLGGLSGRGRSMGGFSIPNFNLNNLLNFGGAGGGGRQG